MKELAVFAAFILAVRYVSWEVLVFVVVVGGIVWLLQSDGDQ